MRPGIESLARRGIPRGAGVALHYLAVVGLIALFAWLVVPRALGQVETALGVSSVPTSAGDPTPAAPHSTRGQHQIPLAPQKRPPEKPPPAHLPRPRLGDGQKGGGNPNRDLFV